MDGRDPGPRGRGNDDRSRSSSRGSKAADVPTSTAAYGRERQEPWGGGRRQEQPRQERRWVASGLARSWGVQW